MGCAASMTRTATVKPDTNSVVEQQIQDSEVPILAVSHYGHMPTDTPYEETLGTVHPIEIVNGSFPKELPLQIESGDILQFQTKEKDGYDIIQVYRDDNDYYRIPHGFELININNGTSERARRLPLSIAFNQPSMDLYFCVQPTAQRSNTRKCPREKCEQNHLVLNKVQMKFTMNDNRENQKVFLRKGDTIEIEWATRGGYRIEEKKYCPISGGLYTVAQTSSDRNQSKGKYSKIFDQFGMSFLFRLTDKDQVHDITVCIVNETYKIKHIEITDNGIQPDLIWIEQDDAILFSWNTKRKQTIIQVESYANDDKQQPIELKTDGEHFFWPNDPTRCGTMLYQFKETGIFCYRDATNTIGTIIVEPRMKIYHLPVFGDELIHKITTLDLVQFDWKMSDSPDEPFLITVDANSSVVPDTAGGLTGIFDCHVHQCVKVEQFFRHHFHTCETFLLTIPRHGLYNIASSDGRDDVLLSIIVENAVDNHRVIYDKENSFDPPMIFINRFDQVWFESSIPANIYRTDESGNRIHPDQTIFQPKSNGTNYYMDQFRHTGVFYFSTDATIDKPTTPLAVVVLPEIRFHYRNISQNDFDLQPIVTTVNDFVIWQFEKLIRHNVIQLRSGESMQELIACHDRAVAGRNRQCLALECILTGTFFFANPEFERVVGSEQDRLISTVIIDAPFSQACFLVTNRQFIPNILYIAQNDTVTWSWSINEPRHQIRVGSDSNQSSDHTHIDRSFSEFVHDTQYMYTFHECGDFTIQSNRFNSTAMVVVYSDSTILNQKRRVQPPQLIDELDTASPHGTQIRLTCPNRQATIYYTLDGSIPTRRYDHVHKYDPNEGVLFLEAGLHVLRAYATEDEKVSSNIITSTPTFIHENQELEAMNELRRIWNSCKISLNASLRHPNKLYGNIEIEPTSSIDLIDHFELYVDDFAQKVNLAPNDLNFSAEGFAGGEQYEIHVVAYPKVNITDAEPIASNRRAFEIQREIEGGAPLISLAVSNEMSTIFLMWAHLGDHISEYIVYVDNVETKSFIEKDFNDFFGIQFHGAQQRKRYLLHVEAKVKDTNEIRKSNVIAVNPPLEMPLKEQLVDQYFAYITINTESPPPDMRLEIIHLDHFPFRRPEPSRTVETLPITTGIRNAVPTISFKRNPNGVTLFWSQKSQATLDFIEQYRIMLDGEQYGESISPDEEPKFQINLVPGKHECYLAVVPKDKNEETYQSNVLKFDGPSSASKKKDELKQKKEPAPNLPVHKVLERKDIPVPKLTVLTISASSIRTNWYLDRPMPAGAFVAMYEVHVRGQDFPEKMTSDESSKRDDYIEHVWHVTNAPLEISGISERLEYTVFVRALFHVEGLTDTKYETTTSNEVTTARVDPLIDLLTRPLLQVTRIGLQMASLAWKLDDSVDQAIIKGYRLMVNSKPTEILSPKQHEYELLNLKPGTTSEVQVSVTSHPDFVDEKISEPVRILCPQRPTPPTIAVSQAEKPFSIVIKWKIESTIDQDEIIAFKIFLDGKLHEEIDTNGRHSFKYEFNDLKADRTYSIYIKALIGQKKLDGYTYQCEVESNVSNELTLKCAAPPKGTPPRIERMYPNGVDIVWDAPVEYGDVKLTGYQILKNGRAIGKKLPVDKRRTSIGDLELGRRYALQIVPITDQPGATLFSTGEEYDQEKHAHCPPGPKLEVEFTDLIELPKKIWIETITGRSAVVCWSPIDESSSVNIQPESYKLFVWKSRDQSRDNALVLPISKDKTSQLLKDLTSATLYEIQLEVSRKRRHQITNEPYIVSTHSESLTFETGAPPDSPSYMNVIACTNTAARITFDPFVEHNAEIVALRVSCEPIVTTGGVREIMVELTPDSTEVILANLIERTEYTVTVFAITEEYLFENRLRDVSQLPKKLKPSGWLPSKSIPLTTSGCEPATKVLFPNATIEMIHIEWTLPKVYGSTHLIGQNLRWKLETNGEEHTMELDRLAIQTKIPGILPSGHYKIALDSIFSVKINLEEDNDQTESSGRKHIRLTTTESVTLRFRTPALCERPELYLTGYTTHTIDLTWNKPNMFNIVDHPERLNEQIKIHRRLLGYHINVNGRKHNNLDDDQYQCTLTECHPDEEYKIQLVAQTTIQTEYAGELLTDGKDNVAEPDETPSKKLRVRMLKDKDLLQSFQANFEFHHNVTKENTTEQTNEIKPLGKINVRWKVKDNSKDISHFILQWRSSKDLCTQQLTLANNETTHTLDACDEKHFYVIELIIVMNDGTRQQYEKLTMPIPGEPDAPKLWLVKTADSNFVVEWSEPKSYGIPVIGFQLFIEGKKVGDMIAVNLRRAEIPSRINRTYQVNVCAVTNHPQRTRSVMSQTLSVITTPITNLIPTMYYDNDDGGPTSFGSNIARIIPVQIDSITEDKLHIDWTSFLPTPTVRAYYVHYTCLNNGDVQALKVSKRHRHAVVRDLRPGFTYGIMVMAVDKNGGVLYTSDKSTVQMSAPPNAPIVAIRERTNDHVTIEWRPAASYGELAVVGYKIFVNNRLAAILSHDQLTYTLTNGVPCDVYTVHVQALSNDKHIASPMSRSIQFSWPGIKPGAFRRLDDGQTGTIVIAWEHPQLEDETEKLIGYKLFSENVDTHAVRLHGEFDAATHQASIYDLIRGKHRLWLEIQSEHHCVRARPLTIMFGRFTSLRHRPTSFDTAKCFMKKSKRFRSSATSALTPPLRHIQYS